MAAGLWFAHVLSLTPIASLTAYVTNKCHCLNVHLLVASFPQLSCRHCVRNISWFLIADKRIGSDGAWR